jgi:maltoporin
MVIEVDDSGWGDLIGGAVIVMRRVETNEEHTGEIPPELFKSEEFKYKTYLRYATQIILEGIDALSAEKTEPIHICTGYIFDHAKDTLKELGYKVTEVKIEGKTQDLAERTFIESLERQGIGSFSEVAAMRSFNGFLDWVKEDLEDRERFVKTGWKNWPRHRDEE